MPNIEYIPFKPWHLKLFKVGQQYHEPLTDNETRAFLYRRVEGVTVLIDGDITFIIGVLRMWPGVAEVTMIPSDKFYQFPKTCLKICKTLLQNAFEMYDLHRLQVMVHPSYAQHIRFIEAFGFAYEATLHKYGHNQEDFHLYWKEAPCR